MTNAIILATGFLIMFVGSGARFAIGLTLKPMAEDFAMGRGMLGVTVAAYFVVTAICMFVSGRLIDRFDPRGVLAAGLVISAAGIGLVGVVQQPWHVLVLYGLVFGVGNGLASITPVSIMVTRLYPRRAGAANGFISAGMSAGQLFIIAAMVFVLAGTGWRPVYVWLGVAHLVLLPLVWAMPRQIDAGGRGRAQAISSNGDGMSLTEALQTRRFWLLLGIYALCGLDDFFVSTHIVAFAQDKGLDVLLAGNLLAVIGATALLGVLVAGAWSDRSGPWWPLLICFVLRAVSFAMLMLDQSIAGVAVFTLVFGITFLMTAPLTVILIRNAFGNAHLGSISGLVIMVHHMCGGLGAWIGGLVFDQKGNYDAAFQLMLVSAVAAVVMALMLRSERIDNVRPPGKV